VRLLAARRHERAMTESAALVSEILTGRRAPALPPCIVAALDGLDAVRAETPQRAALSEAG
jgi:hypothetical protein